MKYKITYIFYFKSKDGSLTTRKATKIYEDFELQKQIKAELFG